MLLQEFQDYVQQCGSDLVKIEPAFEIGESLSSYYLTKVKETYVYGDEEDADTKVNDARQSANFESAKKTFKAGKISKKTGDILTPDTWKVVIVYKF